MKINKWKFNLLALIAVSISLTIGGVHTILAQGKKDKAEVITAERIIKDIKIYQKEVEDIRGKKFKADTTVKNQSMDEFKQFVKAGLDEELPKEKAQLIQAAWSKLGLIPKDYDLRKGLENLVVSQAGAYYDNKTKTVYLIKTDALPPSIVKMAIVHELCHALQDQYFDLTKIMKDSMGDYDYSAAMRFLYEGEASYVGNFYAAKEMLSGMGMDMKSDDPMILQQFMLLKSMSREAVLKQNDAEMGQLSGDYPAIKASLDGAKTAPPFLYWELSAPYVSGVANIAEIIGLKLKNQKQDYTGGWQNVDIAYSAKLVSTEQIFHPAKLLTEKDEPTAVTQPELPESWEVAYSDNLGEFGFWTLYDVYGIKDPAKAADGWDGDKYFLLKNKESDNYALYFSTVWDTNNDAADSFEAYQKIVVEKNPDWKKSDDSTKQSVTWNSPDGKFTVIMALENNKWISMENIPSETVKLWKTPLKKD
ncbi:MAG: hypothetical protein HY811_10115 [Planctomycetes bacterium]|nr:hypothetical protein [Planctomycetota bacterium]